MSEGPHSARRLAPLLIVLTGCASLVGLEPTIPEASAASFRFPSCSAAPRALVCDESPAPADWDVVDICSAASVPESDGSAALRVACPGPEIDYGKTASCARRQFSAAGGIRLRMLFEAVPASPEGKHEIVTIRLQNGALLYVIQTMDSLFVTITDATDKRQASASFPEVDGRHELGLHVNNGGAVTVVGDGRTLLEGLGVGALGDGMIAIDLLHCMKGTGPESVTVENVIALSY